MLRSFASPRFRRYALAKFLSLVGQNALVYAVFILVIQRQESAFATSFYLVASILPSVLLSVPGGLTADSLPRKGVLVVVGLLRTGIVLAFVVNDLGLGTVIALTFAVWSAWQFYTPAENAALRAVVQREGLAGANAALQVVSIGAQLVGAGFLAPIGLKLTNADTVFVVCAAGILAASFLYGGIPALTPREEARPESRNLLTGIRLLRGDPHAMQAALILALVSSALMVLIVAVPEFLSSELRTSASNAVYIFSPAAGGFAVGLFLAPVLARVVGSRSTSLLGYVCFALCLVALGNIGRTTTFWVDTASVPLDRLEDLLTISPRIAATLLTVPLGGLGLALANVGARTLLYERAPEGAVAQLLAAQSALGSLIGIVPTIAAGFFVEVADVSTVLIGLAAVLVALGLLQIWRQRPGRRLVPLPAD